MFDIGWSEIVVIAVVALIAIGPKELPGVLRMVGQWMGKARKMAAEFQGQFQEAMREAEMADLKKSFDEVKEAATGLTSGGLMTSLQKDVSDALRIDEEKPAPAVEPPVTPTEPVPPTPDSCWTSISRCCRARRPSNGSTPNSWEARASTWWMAGISPLLISRRRVP